MACHLYNKPLPKTILHCQLNKFQWNWSNYRNHLKKSTFENVCKMAALSSGLNVLMIKLLDTSTLFLRFISIMPKKIHTQRNPAWVEIFCKKKCTYLYFHHSLHWSCPCIFGHGMVFDWIKLFEANWPPGTRLKQLNCKSTRVTAVLR